MGATHMNGDTEHTEGVQQPKRRRWRRWLRWTGSLLIVAGILVALYPLGTEVYGWWAQRELRAQLAQASPAFVTSTTQLASTQPSQQASSQTPVTTEPALPSPAQVAAAQQAAQQARLDAFRLASASFQASVQGKSGTPIGRIVIPSIGMDVVMVEGAGTGDLKEGPGHWPETVFPGQLGNFVVSGHRTTYGAPFRKLDKIKVGDEIQLVLPYAVVRYRVTRVIVVLPTQVDEVAQLGREQVSLAACHPIYSASHRIVVQGDMIDFTLFTSPQSH